MKIEAGLRLRRGDFELEAEMSIPMTGVTALFGPSGCGKTTLLRAIAGLEAGAEGYLRVGDQVWQDVHGFLAPHRRSLGYVFQEASLFPHLSVKRNLAYGYRRIAQSDRRVVAVRTRSKAGRSSRWRQTVVLPTPDGPETTTSRAPLIPGSRPAP